MERPLDWNRLGGVRIIKAVKGGIVIKWAGAESDQDMWCHVSHSKRLF